jgi:3-oxoadipate enol-lactonase
VNFTTAGGVTLHHAHTTNGSVRPLLVFINSLGTDFRIWDAIVPAFRDTHPMLRYDKRGHGLSDLGSPPYTIDDHVDDLCALLDHVGAGDVIACGLSVGGLVAQGLAARRPRQLRGLILCDTAHKIGTDELWNARIDAITSKGIASIADGILERWFTPAFRSGRRSELAGCRNMLVRQPAEGYAGTCAALRDADHTALVQKLAVPTLCIVGDQDGSTPPDLVKSMADLIAGSRFEIIANAGHIPCVEQPEALVALMRDFLSANELG